MTTLRNPLTLLLLLFGLHASANPWASVPGPASGPSRAIGDTSAGCISGARTLPTEGEGYVVMHLERNRYYGHPSLISSIRSLGERAARGLGVMHVGDLGMARGGPMPFGHRSHQTGLDADVWFDLSPSLHLGANRNRSNVSAYSLLSKVSDGLNYQLWSDSHAQMLKTAATEPSVDRIFVNARIKQELCQSTRGDRSWLHKIRPWYHHEDHFHMRLACPSDSPSCVRQKPIPPGDGCDELTWWLKKTPDPVSPIKPPPPPKPVMPAECRSLLSQY
jgi:penicillin-insensitive murein DD-endopeptidase